MKTITISTFIVTILSLALSTNLIHAAALPSQEELNAALMKAVRENSHQDEIVSLVKQRADIDAISTKGRTPLLYAIHNDNLEITKTLLTLGANPNTPGTSHTPLQLAARTPNNPITKLLLDHQADVNMNSGTKADSTALISAMRAGCIETISELLARNALIRPLEPIHDSALHFALRTKKSPAIIELCLKHLLGNDEGTIAFNVLFEKELCFPEASSQMDMRWTLTKGVQPVGKECVPNSYTAAISIHTCVENHQSPLSKHFYDYYQEYYKPTFHFINQKTPHCNILEKGTRSLDLMQAAKEYSSSGKNLLPFCALICGDSEQLYTTDQLTEHIALGIPDYSGPRTQNKSLLAKIEEVNAKGYGSIPILCIIKFNNPPGHPPVSDSARHCVLINIVKEKDQDPYILYYDTNSQYPQEQPDVLRWIYFINHYYVSKLDTMKIKKRKHDAALELPANDEQAPSKKAHDIA